jgi:hypothetical protein
LLHYPAPVFGLDFRDEPVRSGDESFLWVEFALGTNIYSLPGGWITTSVNRKDYSIVNQTQVWHWLHDGKVTRRVIGGSGGVSIHTIGVGNNRSPVFALLNEVFGKRIFKAIDENIQGAYNGDFKGW